MIKDLLQKQREAFEKKTELPSNYNEALDSLFSEESYPESKYELDIDKVGSFLSSCQQEILEEVVDNPVVKEFLEATPEWLKQMDNLENHGGAKDLCVFCGMKPSKIEELLNVFQCLKSQIELALKEK